MNDHNLDDLIIDTIEPKNGKAKSMLTIVGLLIIVFIVAILLISVLSDDSKSDVSTPDENDSEMISPELTLQSAAKVRDEKEGPKLTEIIEEELNKPIPAPKISQDTVETKKTVHIEKPVEKGETIPAPLVKEGNEAESTNEFTQTSEKPEVSSAPEKVTTPEAVIPEKVVKKEPVATKTKKVVTVPKTTGIQYFIQVGSYRQTPSKRFLSVIKNKGFHYHITAASSSGIKKLLIGPYPDRAAANVTLVRVRDLINKSAFVVKK